MVIFKESYDLTRRTPTPPAQRFHREQARRRQQQREAHVAKVRGKYDVKRRDTSNNAAAANEPAPVTRWGGMSARLNGRSGSLGNDAGGDIFSQSSRAITLRESPADTAFNSQNLSAAAVTQPMQGFAVMQASPVTNDSFSAFFGAIPATARRTPLANMAISTVGSVLHEAEQHHHQRHHFEFGGALPQQQQHHSPSSVAASSCYPDRDLNPPCGFDTLDDPTSLFEGEKRITGEDHFEKFNFDRAPDEVRVAATVKEFKRLVVDSGANIASNSRATAAMTTSSKQTVHPRKAEFDRRDVNSLASCRRSADPKDQQHVIEGLLGTTQRMTAPSLVERETIRILKQAATSDEHQQQRGGQRGGRPQSARSNSLHDARPDPLSVRLAHSVSDAKLRRSPDAVSEGGGASMYNSISGSHRRPNRSVAASATSATIVLPSAAESVPRPPPDHYKRATGRARSEADNFTRQAQQLAAEKEAQHQADPDPLSHRPPFRLKNTSASSMSAKQRIQLINNLNDTTAMMCNNSTSSSQQQQKQQLMSKYDKNLSKRLAQEAQLEEEVREDIRLFEWRRSAQQHARAAAQVAVRREKELATFEKRQCERFTEALARFEPGALQRTERAIQHRIAHQLVSKYGPSAFVTGNGGSDGGEGGPESDRDIVIPESFQVCAREAALIAAETARQQLQAARRNGSAGAGGQQQAQQQHQQQHESPRQGDSVVQFKVPAPPSHHSSSMSDYVDKSKIESSGYGKRRWRPCRATVTRAKDEEEFASGAAMMKAELDAFEHHCPTLLVEQKQEQAMLLMSQVATSSSGGVAASPVTSNAPPMLLRRGSSIRLK